MKMIIFLHVTRYGASLSNLNELFHVGLTGNLSYHVYAEFSAVNDCYVHHQLRFLCNTVGKNVFKVIMDYY